jgi:bifunctional DNA-binding transcriptional regulator/antitoxin component of YhaV-PrlF toxin-antitoxin module
MIFMHEDMITTVTERGQTSIPAKLRRKAGLSPSKRLHWFAVSDREFRVVVETTDEAPGPLAALGWATRYHRGGTPRTDDALREIRAGEDA